MRDWVILYYRGVPFVVGGITEENKNGKEVFESGMAEGDFLLISRCTAAELPYPFWYVGERNVYIRDYNQFTLETSGESAPTKIGIRISK